MRPIAEVDLGALLRNVERLRNRCTPATQLLAAVKADAYGHGLVPVARALTEGGVGWLGVATPDEASALRAAGIAARILIFGPLREDGLDAALDADADLTVCDDDDVSALARAISTGGRRRADGTPPVRLHLKVDTGMGRLGRRPEHATQMARTIVETPGVKLAAVWTHFACADEPARDLTARQQADFDGVCAALDADGLLPPLRHAANSAAVLAHPATHYELVRPGIALYGYPPSAHLNAAADDLEPVLHLDAPVVAVRRLRAGEALSYGHTWSAPSDTTVATVRFGYADGYPRALSNLGQAMLNERSCRVVGTVCMDQLMLDVGDAPVGVGDRATLIGPDGPRADELAVRAGTICYELLTRLGTRIERRYLARDG